MLKTNHYNKDPKNVLVIGDLHAPFIVDGYLEFCKKVHDEFNCGTVIFIGDLADFHYSSFHAIESSALGADNEYDKMLETLKPWVEAFPVARITYGNHDLIPLRKGFAGGLARRTMKSWQDLFCAPTTWEFGEKFLIDNVMYLHGTNAALARMNASRISTVQGHCHSLQYVQWSQSEKDRIFAMQVGCGISNDKYAFNYGRSFPKKPILGCGVILNGGKVPLVIPMHV
jgi:hypothetical protein